MSYIVAIWILWAVLAVIVLGLVLYRVGLTQYEEGQLFIDDADSMRHRDQNEMLSKVKRLEPIIRIFGGVEALATLAIVAFYVMDAFRQF